MRGLCEADGGVAVPSWPDADPSRHGRPSKMSAAAESPPATRTRIDALVAGVSDQHAFLREVRALVQAVPDEICEILSVIDQYYRLGKIPHEVYQPVDRYLGALLVRSEQSTCTSVPLPQRTDRSSAVRSIAPAETMASRPIAAGPFAADSPAPTAEEVDQLARVLRPGDVLRGRYRLLTIVGQGGMATIWEAIDQYLVGVAEDSRRLAIKVLRSEVVQRPPVISALLNEFVHLRSLSHPNIVRVHEFDRDGDTAFMTMELLTGAPLGRILSAHDGTALDRGRAYTIIREIGAALAHAHARGVVHGDINPENIFLTGNGEVRVLDFGTSLRVNSAPPILVAAPGYASCEVLEGGVPNASDDLFALACVAYFLLSGKHPFASRTAIEARAARSSPARPAELTLGQWNALREGLDFRYDRRPADVAKWVHRLDPVMALQPLPALSAPLPVPPRWRQWGLMATLAAVLILLTAGGLWMTNTKGRTFPLAAAMRAGLGQGIASYQNIIVREWHQVLQQAAMRHDAAEHSSAHSAMDRGAVAFASRLGNRRGQQDDGHNAHRAVLASVSKAPLVARATIARAPVHPRRVPVDQPALARIELTSNLISVAQGSSFVQIVIQRRGNSRRTVSFTWRTEPGTAMPGKDFVGFAPGIAHIETGRRSVSLVIPIVSDPGRLEPKRFYVKIDDPGPGALLGERTIAMITIPASQ